MNDIIFGVYGYQFSRPFAVSEIEYTPLLARSDVRERAADRDTFHLTGYGRFETPQDSRWDEVDTVITHMAAMTFCQQQHVLSSALVEISEGDSVEAFLGRKGFPETMLTVGERFTGGPAVISDWVGGTSRRDFIDLFTSNFGSEARSNDALRKAMFRQIEVWRLSTAYVEIHHFLVFSGLELLSRSETGTTGGSAAIPISQVLQKYGFAVSQRDVERWSAARNAAFHRGELVCADPYDKTEVSLAEQLYPMTQLLADLCLRMLGFDDGRINWNRWSDRMGFT